MIIYNVVCGISVSLFLFLWGLSFVIKEVFVIDTADMDEDKNTPEGRLFIACFITCMLSLLTAAISGLISSIGYFWCML